MVLDVIKVYLIKREEKMRNVNKYILHNMKWSNKMVQIDLIIASVCVCVYARNRVSQTAGRERDMTPN